MNVTSVELQAYFACPLYHERKYIRKDIPERNRTRAHFDGHSHIVERAERAIRELTSFYFHRLMDERQVRYSTLFRKWERLWWEGFSGEDILEYIVPANRANMIRTNTNLVLHLPKFHSTFHKPFRPLLVDKAVNIPFREHSLTASIQMAYRMKNGCVRIVEFIPYRIAPRSPAKDLNLVTQACGWLYASEEKEVEIAYYCMMSPSEYNPFTVVKLEAEQVMPNMTKVLTAFMNKTDIDIAVDCSGCEYRCEVPYANSHQTTSQK